MFDGMQKIVANPKLHSQFLNTLAMMEFLGAQKISCSLSFLTPTANLLEHVNEEYRHAHFLRAQALKLDQNNNSFDPCHTMNFHRSRSYLFKLDALITRQLKKHYGPGFHKKWPYLLTTYAIEKRALPFYESYQALLSNVGSPIKIQSIISEEKSHLLTIEKEIESEKIPNTLINESLIIEQKLFKRWLDGMAPIACVQGVS